MPARLILATRNPYKVEELRRILDGVTPGIDLVGLDAYPELPDVVETGVTFAENALLKASFTAGSTGLPAIADDSGLAVDVLGGAPGVFSARWSGRHGDDDANLDLLLAQLADVPDEHRQAQFLCAAAFVAAEGAHVGALADAGPVVMGRLTGRLIRSRRGTGGFGYDPIFVADGQARTNAELDPAEKDAISHRGNAFRALAERLPALLAGQSVPR